MINIMFCGNHGVFDGMLTCALSIFRRSELNEGINFYLLTMDVSHLNPKFTPITEKQVAFFEKVIKKENPENNVIVHDVTDLYMEVMNI